MFSKQSRDGFFQGINSGIYEDFGAHVQKEGTLFRVYAPRAKKVTVIGSFNQWNGQEASMTKMDDRGIWEITIPTCHPLDQYKYQITTANGSVIDKADPLAFYSELRPGTASVVFDLHQHVWKDQAWVSHRNQGYKAPINIYEIHAGGWRRHQNRLYTYEDLKRELIPYLLDTGFNYVEFMPLNEHPFDGSWGYQAHGYFSCTSRYGTPLEFMDFVDACHQNNIGVIMDIVPVHFVKDEHGLRSFDGEPLYEYTNPKDANSEWGTLNFDLAKAEVRSFLSSAACFWCDKYHVDGLRTDAVANIIFWGGNKDNGTNQEALEFLKRMNYALGERFPGAMRIAEDSSDFPYVTKEVNDGGLGFDYKWDLGWMNDTLRYYEMDPIYRKWHHNQITFSMAYFYSEHFILPLSHDEVVHGKHMIVDRMWGSYEQKMAQAKNLYAYMMTHPGKKLNFMGNECALFREFDEAKELDWFLLTYSHHQEFLRFFSDLNQVYLQHPCLYEKDYEQEGFHWIDADNGEQSVYSYWRENGKEAIIVILNMTPASYDSFTVGVPYEGTYTEVLNTEKGIYGGSDRCNTEPLKIEEESFHGQPYRLNIHLAPFVAVLLHTKVQAPKPKKRGKEQACSKTKKNS